MKTYWVQFDFGDYVCESVRVYAYTLRQVRAIMRRQYGNAVKIRRIEEE